MNALYPHLKLIKPVLHRALALVKVSSQIAYRCPWMVCEVLLKLLSIPGELSSWLALAENCACPNRSSTPRTITRPIFHSPSIILSRPPSIARLTVEGAVRVQAALATRVQVFTAQQLAPSDLQAWRDTRAQVSFRQESRCKQARFRRDPVAYLANLEAKLLKDSLRL